MTTHAHAAISRVLVDYLEGLHTGDVERLSSVFHASAVLWGEVKGQPYYKALQDYLAVVRARKSPREQGEPFVMEILAIELHDKIARATVSCPMLGFNYLDMLSLVYLDERWWIVSKVFTHIEP